MSTKVAIVPVKDCQQNCVTRVAPLLVHLVNRTYRDSDVGLETNYT